MPAYSPIRQRILQELSLADIRSLAFTARRVIFDAIAITSTWVRMYLVQRSFHAAFPSSLRLYILSHRISPVPYDDTDARFMGRLLYVGLAFHVLCEFWATICPSPADKMAAVNYFVGGHSDKFDRRRNIRYLDTIRFLEAYVISDAEYAAPFTADVMANLIFDIVDAANCVTDAFHCIQAIRAATKTWFDYDLTKDEDLSSARLYRRAIDQMSVPLVVQLWNDIDRRRPSGMPKSVNIWSGISMAVVLGHYVRRDKDTINHDMLHFFGHIFPIHGPCSVDKFWFIMPRIMRENDELAGYLADMYETKVFPARHAADTGEQETISLCKALCVAHREDETWAASATYAPSDSEEDDDEDWPVYVIPPLLDLVETTKRHFGAMIGRMQMTRAFRNFMRDEQNSEIQNLLRDKWQTKL